MSSKFMWQILDVKGILQKGYHEDQNTLHPADGDYIVNIFASSLALVLSGEEGYRSDPNH